MNKPSPLKTIELPVQQAQEIMDYLTEQKYIDVAKLVGHLYNAGHPGETAANETEPVDPEGNSEAAE